MLRECFMSLCNYDVIKITTEVAWLSKTTSLSRKTTMDLLFCILVICVRILHVLVYPLYLYKSRGKKNVVPPMNNDLLLISATNLAEKIRQREITSKEVCEAYIHRIQEVNPILNAIVEDRFDEAIKEARSADEYLRKSVLTEDELKCTKPLLGVPLTIKESCAVQGMLLTSGLVDLIEQRCEEDGEIVSRLKSAGAIILSISNTPELCMFPESHNYVTGTTKNPYDTTCTSGGSSGGEGSLIGAGASVIGIGSDVAGSIRLPAAFNGVFGHKPTPKIASVKGHYPSSADETYLNYAVIGPITRYAQDLRLVMRVIVDPQYQLMLGLNDKVDISTLRVFFKEDSGSWLPSTTQKEIQSAVVKAAKHLEKCGATLETYKFPELKDALQVCGKTLYDLQDIPSPLQEMAESGETEFFKSLLGYSKFTSHVLYSSVIQKRMFDLLVADHSSELNRWKDMMSEKLRSNGVFIYPTCNTSAFKHHEGFFRVTAAIYTVIANAMCLPATNVPCGFDHRGMPFGIQVISAPFQDNLCLSVAEELERYFGGFNPKYRM